jgi:predicted metalloprotease with PDZ domain
MGGMIGNETLSRFDVVLDMINGALYLKPNKQYASRFPAKVISGMEMKSLRDDFKTVVIHAVNPASPADIAGVKANDELLSVNGHDTRNLTLDLLNEELQKPQSHRLVVKRDGVLLKLKLKPIVIR